MSNENRADKGLQILQTIILAALLGVGSWNLKTTVELKEGLATQTESGRQQSKAIERCQEDIVNLRVFDNALSSRITVLETRGTK